VEVSESESDSQAGVTWAVDPADETSAQPNTDPDEVEAAVAGAQEMLNLLSGIGIDTTGRTVDIAHVQLNVADSEPTAVRAAAAMATARAFEAADRFKLTYDQGWQVRATDR
jgi:hypothetical protein